MWSSWEKSHINKKMSISVRLDPYLYGVHCKNEQVDNCFLSLNVPVLADFRGWRINSWFIKIKNS